jgi:NitT/TauT family transport system permease protein
MNRPNETSKVLVWSLQALIVIVTIGGWEWVASQSRKAHFFFSQPSEIIQRVWQWFGSGEIWTHISITMAETFFGFFGGIVLGLLLAFWCYRSPLTEKVLLPFFGIANAIPRLILGPIFVLWFGLGIASKAMLGVSLIVFIVFFATFRGLKEVDQSLINKVRLLGGTHRDVMLHVLIPSAFSWVFTSLRTSVGFALVAAVVGEYMGSSKGVGHLIQFSEGMFDATGVFAGLLVLSLLAIIINAVLEKVEAQFTGWRLQ